MIGGLGQEMPGAGEDLQLAVTDEHAHHRRGIGRQDFVTIAVEEKHGYVVRELACVFTAGRLRGKGEHAGAMLTEDHPCLYRDRAAERMPDGHEPRSTRP